MNLLKDATGRPYEDFYLPVTRNEKKDDWMSVIVPLKRHFNGYMKYVHCDASESFQGQNSTAQEGNFLEAINLSLNGKALATNISSNIASCWAASVGSLGHHVGR